MATNFDGITLRFSESTKSKIAAYAVLSRQNVDTVIGQLEGLIDDALKEKCIELLGGAQMVGEAQGVTYPITNTVEEIPVIPVKTAKKPKSFADAHKRAAAPPPLEEEAFSAIEGGEHVPQHELSDDEDNQENRSLEDQVGEELDPEEEEQFRQAGASRRAPNVGKNAEAFLDTAMGEPEESDVEETPTITRGYAGQGAYGERPVKATKTFESRIRQGRGAKVSPHTGDED